MTKKIYPVSYRTIGKLLNPRGYIPGELGAFGTPWGKLRGPLDTIERLTSFKPKKGALGVLLSRRKYIDENQKVKNGVFITSLMPREVTHTKKMQITWERTRILSKIASKHKSDMIYPIWEPLVKIKTKKPYGGYYYFMSLNGLNLGNSLNWSKLLVSNGKLMPPERVCSNCYNPETKQIHIILPKTVNCQPLTINPVGIAIFDVLTGDFFHLSPEQIKNLFPPNNDNPKTFLLTWKLKQVRKYYRPVELISINQKSHFYIYFYYKAQGNFTLVQTKKGTYYKQIPSTHNSSFNPHNSLYSPSISSKIKTCKPPLTRRKTTNNSILISLV